MKKKKKKFDIRRRLEIRQSTGNDTARFIIFIMLHLDIGLNTFYMQVLQSKSKTIVNSFCEKINFGLTQRNQIYQKRAHRE